MTEIAAPIRRNKRIKREGIWGVCLAVLPIIGYALFSAFPIVLAFIMSFMSIKGLKIDSSSKFIGFGNYADVLKDPLFYKSIANTFYAAVALPIALILSLAISVLLAKEIRGKKIYRTIFFIPFVCSMVALTLMWKRIFDFNYGVLNTLVVQSGGERIKWLLNEKYLMPCMIVMGVWGGMGFNIILYTAALTNVNKTYYEAAEIDGAGAWRKFFSITLPAISPTTFYLLVMGLIGALQDFTRFQVMTGDGSPNNSGLTIVFYLYNYIFGAPTSGGGSYIINIGKASTMAIMLSGIIGIITVANFKLSKKWVSYD